MERVSSGSLDFNRFLDGGYERGVVSMLVGGPATGKTNLSILCACSVALKKKVVFIDTEGGFSVERVSQIVGKGNLDLVLSNIVILKPRSFSEQRDCFLNLKDYINSKIGLVVVDSIAMLYRLEIAKKGILSDDSSEIRSINYDIVSQMEQLSAISRKNDIPVLITNQVYSNFNKVKESNSDCNIVGGDLFQYWSKCIIEFRKGISRKAVLLKHRSLPEREFFFDIKDKGVFKKKGVFW